MDVASGVIRALTASRARLDEARERLRAAAADLADVRDAVAGLTAGSSNDSVTTGLASYDTAAAAAADAVGSLAAAGEALASYLSHLDGTGAHGTGPERSVTTDPPRPTRAPPSTTGARPAGRPPPDPAMPAPYAAGLFDRLRTRRSDKEPTDGVLATIDGTEIAKVRSGWSGPGHGGPGLAAPWKLYTAATDHAEGHAAALFRRLWREHGLRDATLYVNNLPCRNRFGCDRLLPDILPPGARLTVYGPGGW